MGIIASTKLSYKPKEGAAEELWVVCEQEDATLCYSFSPTSCSLIRVKHSCESFKELQVFKVKLLLFVFIHISC